jgi:hypothetical protein
VISPIDTVTVQAVTDLCVEGKGKKKLPPSEMLMLYEGDDVNNVNLVVWIVVEHPKDGEILNQEVSDGETFVLTRGGPPSRKLNPRLDVTIYDGDPSEGGEAIAIDSFSIHTSCSVPLLIGDTFGTDQGEAKLTILGVPLS